MTGGVLSTLDPVSYTHLNVFVAGSAVFGSDPAARVKEFNEIFKEYEK